MREGNERYCFNYRDRGLAGSLAIDGIDTKDHDPNSDISESFALESLDGTCGKVPYHPRSRREFRIR